MTLSILLFIVFLLLHFITVVLAWQVWKRAAKSWRPMLLFLLVNFMLEFTDSFAPDLPFRYVRTQQVQGLVSVLLILWQARKWKVFDRQSVLFYLLGGLILAAWVFEWLFFAAQPLNGSPFLVISSFSITLLAIEMMNRNLPQSPLPSLRNPVFLFCAGLIFHFTLLGLLELFGGSLKGSSQSTLYKTYYFYSSLCILIQLLYIRSVLCIPAKDKLYTY